MSPFSNLSKANPRVQHTRISLSFPSKIQSMKTTPCWRYYCRIRSSDVVEKGLLVIGVYTLVDFNFCLLLLCCYWRRWARVSKTCTCTGTPRSTVDSTVEVYWYTLSFFFSFFSLFFKQERREKSNLLLTHSHRSSSSEDAANRNDKEQRQRTCML